MKPGDAYATSAAAHEFRKSLERMVSHEAVLQMGTRIGALPLISGNTDDQRWITEPSAGRL
jgi:hypothetical protein